MRLTLILLASVLLVPDSADAQDTDVMQMGVSTLLPTATADVKAVYKYAFCAATASSNQSRLILRSLPSSKASDRALFWTSESSCGNAQLAEKFSPRSRRGPIAEYYLKRDFNVANWQQKHYPLTVFNMPSNVQFATLSSDVRNAVALIEVGACVARDNPTGVSVLMASEFASLEQSKAVAALSPTLAACIPPKFELKTSSFLLRGYVAEGMYLTLAGRAHAMDGKQ